MTTFRRTLNATFAAIMDSRTTTRTKKCTYCGCRYFPLSSFSFCCEECKMPSRGSYAGRAQYRGALAAASWGY